MKVLVCGSRGWTDGSAVVNRLHDLLPDVEVLTGGAPGADTFAFLWATELRNVPCHVFRPNWKGHGRRAGILRNLAMLDQAPDLVLAFWDGESPGTAHTIREARRRGIPVEVNQ